MSIPADLPLLLGFDIGSTHCKAGLFSLDGQVAGLASCATPLRTAPSGYRYIDAEELWAAAAGLVLELGQAQPLARVAAVGVASMAETGLLVESTGAARTPLFPWFDTSAASETERLQQVAPAEERFLVSGIYPNYKASLAKILWAMRQLGTRPEGATWLSSADFIACRLSGALATDYSLAGRTYAFNIYEKTWDTAYLRALGLPAELYPQAVQSGTPAGGLLPGVAARLGLPAGIPVCVAGHDHICAALATGVTTPGILLDSMGTAEALTGVLPLHPLGDHELFSGFNIGCHVTPGQLYWQGGLSSSGGSLEWLRGLFPERQLSYAELVAALDEVPPEPGSLLYFPYLVGCGSPHSDAQAAGAFLGLRATHRLGHLVRAVLEGTAFEIEYMRRLATLLDGGKSSRMIATGGGLRVPSWLQIKADVTGCPHELARTPEAVLLGAALMGGVGAGLYADAFAAAQAVARPPETIFEPDSDRHAQYTHRFETGFQPLIAAVCRYHPG